MNIKRRIKPEASNYPNVASLMGAAGSLKKPMEWSKMLEVAREDRIIDVSSGDMSQVKQNPGDRLRTE